jgi:uncharacterized phage protein (TIGR01671 family)
MIPNFRAWDKENKKMIDVDILNWNNGEVDFIGDGITFILKANDIELMQSTGLTDKNGKEIFEGDIIAINLEGIETPITAKVFQNRKIGILMFHAFEDNEDVPMVELLEGNSVEFAIIGNIWEDPELTEVNHDYL